MAKLRGMGTRKPFVILWLFWAINAGEATSVRETPQNAKTLNDESLERISRAVPAVAPAVPRKPRKLLIFDLNVGYGGHPSAAHANHAFKLMGERTRAFETVISRDPTVFAAGSLEQYDAVFFNNTVGNLFTDAGLRENLVRFVYRGGGLMGVHGTTVAFTHWPGAVEDWPEFGLMIGARGANHRESNEHVYVKLDEPEHPVNAPFQGKGFEYRDEFFRVHEPYSRRRVRVLFSIDTERTDLQQGRSFGNVERADNDYALAWVRSYGRGRTFYCTIAHNPYVFWDPLMLKFYLGAVQFVFGDLPGSAVPSAFATPAVRAQEKLGWRIVAQAQHEVSVYDAADQASKLGVVYLSVSSTQPVSTPTSKAIGEGLNLGDFERLRFKLDSAGVQILGYEIAHLPRTDSEWQGQFALARDLGAEFVVCSPPSEMADRLSQLCCEFDLWILARTTPKGNQQQSLSTNHIRDGGLRTGVMLSVPISATGQVNYASVFGQVENKPLAIELRNGGLPRPPNVGVSNHIDYGVDVENLLVAARKARMQPTLLFVRLDRPEIASKVVEQVNNVSLRMAE